MTAHILAIFLYIFILFPLTVTLIQQFKIIGLHKQNGLQNYRKAMAIIIASHLLDAFYITAILVLSAFGLKDSAVWLMIGIPFFLVRTVIAGGAWLYYFIYKGSDMSFLSWKFWITKGD